MARVDTFTGLSEFLAVAEAASFRAAATRLAVSAAAVSQAIKALEARLGLPLFVRTTRSVSLTEAGARLHQRLRAATGEIHDALAEFDRERSRPGGVLRLTVPRIAMPLVVLPVLPSFRAAYPELRVELDINDATVDLAAEGLDAGIRIGRFIERDMVAVQLTPPFRWRVMGSPDYFAANGVPREPEALLQHRCIAYRFPTARTVYRWQFQRQRRVFAIDIGNDLVVNDHLSMIDLACNGLGLCYTAEQVAAAALKRGELRAVLAPFAVTDPGLHLYFPRRSQQQPKLRAFIDHARDVLRARVKRG